MIGFKRSVIAILSVILLVGSWGLGAKCFAQDYQLDIRQLGVKEGLLHREVNAIHQDSEGFLWFATPLGLNRYDGYQFKYFTQKSYHFQTNNFEIISEDQAGKLWLIGLDPLLNSGNIATIDILDPRKDTAFTFEDAFPDNGLFEVSELRASCLQGKNGELIFQSSKTFEIFLYTPDRGFRKTIFENLPQFELKVVDPEGNYWGQAPEFDWIHASPEGKVLHRISFDEKFGTAAVSEVHEGGFFVYSHSMPYRLVYIDWNGSAEEFDFLPLKETSLRMPRWRFLSSALLAERRSEGLGRADDHILNQLFDYFGDHEGYVFRSYLKTSSNEIWVGGSFGVYQIQLGINPFTHYLASPFEENRRGGLIPCRGMAVKGDLLAINQEPYRTHLIDISTKKGSVVELKTDNKIGNWALSNYDDDLLIGKTSGLFQIDINGNLVNSWPEIREVGTILEESKDHLWLGLWKEKGIAWFNPLTGGLTQSEDNPILAPLMGQSISHIGRDLEGRIWLCSMDGMYRFDPRDSIFHYFGGKGEGKNFLPFRNVYHFYQDADSIMWIGTQGDGLIRWDEREGTYQQFMREDGLPNNTLYAIYEDEHNHLWIPSDYGIIQFDKLTFKSKTYLPEDGTSEVEFNRLSHTQGPDGRLYFGSLNGVTSFHPDDFYTRETQVEGGYGLRIAEFSQFDSENNLLVNKTAELAETQTICMMPEDRYINLQLALLNFRETELNQYIWRIKGWSDTWQVQTQPEIQLSKLPYGDYDLEIKARTAKGELAANEIRLKVEVVPPFYATWVFILIVVLSVLGLAALVLVLRFRQLRITQEKLERKVKEATQELRELDSLKMRLFANVSHELRTPLTLILGPISSVLKRRKIVDKDAELLKLALQNGQGLEHLITEILDLGKLESGKLSLKESPVHVAECIQKVAASFHATAENKGVKFYSHAEVPENTYLRCDRHLMEKILNNLLANAVKFTPENGSVHFSVSGAPGAPLKFEVSDTGRGIHEDDLPYIFDRYYQAKKGGEQLTGGTGIGLSLSKELVALMGGELGVESEFGKGSTFVFKLPWMGSRIVSDSEVREKLDSREIIRVVSSEERVSPPIKEEDKISILVAEDNADLRLYLKTLLDPLYHVSLARHGKEALQILESTISEEKAKIDLVITDLMMPEMDGFTLLERLRKEKDFALIPVIMLTARTGISDKLRALRLGVHDYLTKPFEEDELLARIENLSQWAKERKLELTEKSLEEPPVFSHEEAWVQEVEAWVTQHFRSTEIKVIDWAISLNLSESQFRRKLKQATGLTPQQYLQEYRLKEARKLLENQIVSTVAEAAYEVGFSAADYFSKVFQKRFGKRPSQYLAT